MTDPAASVPRLSGYWQTVAEVTPLHEAIGLHLVLRWRVLPFATVRIGDCCCLLVAPSHGGKSTLITHALARGTLAGGTVRLIDDNATWCDRSGRAVCLRRPLKVRKPTLDMPQTVLPEHTGASLHRDQSLYIAPTATAPLFSRHRISAVVVLDRHAPAAHFEVLSERAADEATVYHLRQRLGALPAAGFVRSLARVLQTPGVARFKLNYSDPADGVSLLEEVATRHPR